MVGSFSFSSSHWFPDYKVLAQNFLTFLEQMGAKYLRLDSGRLENVVPHYFANMLDFKQRVYGAEAINNTIDHHKILALYTKSFLVNTPFIYPVGIKSGLLRIELLANEFFCVTFIATVFRAWIDGGDHKVLNIPENDLSWLIKLFYQYHKSPETLDILSLSRIIYDLEQRFFVDLPS
jgi:hypothetical protein